MLIPFIHKARKHRNWVLIICLFITNATFSQSLKFDTLCLTTGDIVVATTNNSNDEYLYVTTIDGKQLTISRQAVLPCMAETMSNLRKGNILPTANPKSVDLKLGNMPKPVSKHLINAGVCFGLGIGAGLAAAALSAGYAVAARKQPTNTELADALVYSSSAIGAIGLTLNIAAAVHLVKAGKRYRQTKELAE